MIELTMDQVREMFRRTSFERGMEYYKRGCVVRVRAETEKELQKLEYRIQGEGTYQVSIREQPGGRLQFGCSCYQFYFQKECRHLAAAVIHWVQTGKKRPVSDPNAKNLLKTYMEQGSRIVPEQSDIRLLPRVNDRYAQDYEYPPLSFRVGRQKLYVVKNISDFLSDVHGRRTVPLGKTAELDHSIEGFDKRSRDLIRILMNEQEEFRAVGARRRRVPGYGGQGQSRNEITLTGDAFDRFFALFQEEYVETLSGGQIRLCQGDPQVILALEKRKQLARLRVHVEEGVLFFGHVEALYALEAQRLMRCSDGFREKVYPLLELRSQEIELAYEDMPDFCGCVLLQIEGLVTVEDPDGLLEQYLPEECTPCFYFDMEDELLSLRLKFRYGDREYPENKQPGEKIRRDTRKERQASAVVARYFTPEENGYVLNEQDDAYDFLTESLDRFRKLGEVYVSDRLGRRQIPSTRASVGVSVSDGMLMLDLNTGEFPAGELEGLYQSLLKKKKYHRLADGRFLTLDGGSCEKLAEMAHMLQLSPKELAKGTVKVPAFRALYLDSVLSGGEELNVTRDRQFRAMIRNFKSLSESDYNLPPQLEGVLRPYQCIGFQWLKTLESCGFGGILADEMGLGKTVQVIAYLASLDRERVKHPSLVVCPASLILNWGEELSKFAPELKVSLIYGTAAERKKRMDEGIFRDVW